MGQVRLELLRIIEVFEVSHLFHLAELLGSRLVIHFLQLAAQDGRITVVVAVQHAQVSIWDPGMQGRFAASAPDWRPPETHALLRAPVPNPPSLHQRLTPPS